MKAVEDGDGKIYLLKHPAEEKVSPYIQSEHPLFQPLPTVFQGSLLALLLFINSDVQNWTQHLNMIYGVLSRGC